jgi:hypothetical protein
VGIDGALAEVGIPNAKRRSKKSKSIGRKITTISALCCMENPRRVDLPVQRERQQWQSPSQPKFLEIMVTPDRKEKKEITESNYETILRV